MKLFPREPLKYVALNDSKLGPVEVPLGGYSTTYKAGVYLASRYKDKVKFVLEGNEEIGPAPDTPYLSPDDVVLPDSMQTKSPKKP